MSDIFLSYAKQDRERVGTLARALRDMGWSVFWDQETPVGRSWREHIEDELGQSRCVVVAWSSNAVKSEWVLEEAEYGKSKRVLLPVSLDAGVTPPFGFRTLQSLDMSDWDGRSGHRSFLKLLNGLWRLIGDPSSHGRTTVHRSAAKSASSLQESLEKVVGRNDIDEAIRVASEILEEEPSAEMSSGKAGHAAVESIDVSLDNVFEGPGDLDETLRQAVEAAEGLKSEEKRPRQAALNTSQIAQQVQRAVAGAAAYPPGLVQKALEVLFSPELILERGPTSGRYAYRLRPVSEWGTHIRSRYSADYVFVFSIDGTPEVDDFCEVRDFLSSRSCRFGLVVCHGFPRRGSDVLKKRRALLREDRIFVFFLGPEFLSKLLRMPSRTESDLAFFKRLKGVELDILHGR